MGDKNADSGINLERLLEQIVLLNPNLKYQPEKLSALGKHMKNQLLGEAVVHIEMEPLYDQWEEKLKQQIYGMKRRLNRQYEDEMQIVGYKTPSSSRTGAEDDEIKTEFQRDSSDDEALIIRRGKSRDHKHKANRSKEHSRERSSLSESYENVPLSLRRTPRKRKRSSKYISPAKSKRSYHSHNSVSHHHKKCSGGHHREHHHHHNKQESTVSSSGIIHRCEQESVVFERGTTSRTFNLKIPSLFSSDFQEINFSELKITRGLLDERAQAAKEKCLQKSLNPPQIKKRSHKRKPSICMVESALIPDWQNEHQQREREDAELSQMIDDVIGTTGSEEETWKATNALENINNDIIDNYGVLPVDNFSQMEFLGFENEKQPPKRRYNKTGMYQKQEKQPPKKRGRKSKAEKLLSSQPPTKSNLAQYVESFGNAECDMRGIGSQTPAGSSTRSQPLVSSTTQNFEFIDQQQGTSPVMYYLHGNWESGDPCQLLTTDVNLSTVGSQVATNNLNITYNESACGSEAISLPIITTQFGQNATVDNSIVLPVITTTLPIVTRNETIPPPAHKTADVLDLSVKTNSAFSSNPIAATGAMNNVIVHTDVSLGCPMAIVGENNYDDDMPLDLSINTNNNSSTRSSCDPDIGTLTEPQQCCPVVVDNGQDDDFIRRLIETSDFDLGLDQLPDGNDNNNSSFKAALDMPLLDTIDDDHQNNITTESSSVLANDSTYASMPEDSSNFLNVTLGEDYNFSDESTREIFQQLLNVEPLDTTTTTATIKIDTTIKEVEEEKSHEDKKVDNEDNKHLDEVGDESSPVSDKCQFASPKNPELKLNSPRVINCAGKIRKRRITVTSSTEPLGKSLKPQREQIIVTIMPDVGNEKHPKELSVTNLVSMDVSEKNIDGDSSMSKMREENSVDEPCNDVSKNNAVTEDIDVAELDNDENKKIDYVTKDTTLNSLDTSEKIEDNSLEKCAKFLSVNDERANVEEIKNNFVLKDNQKNEVMDCVEGINNNFELKDNQKNEKTDCVTKNIKHISTKESNEDTNKPLCSRIICEEIKHNETNNIIVITIPEQPENFNKTNDPDIKENEEAIITESNETNKKSEESNKANENKDIIVTPGSIHLEMDTISEALVVDKIEYGKLEEVNKSTECLDANDCNRAVTLLENLPENNENPIGNDINKAEETKDLTLTQLNSTKITDGNNCRTNKINKNNDNVTLNSNQTFPLTIEPLNLSNVPENVSPKCNENQTLPPPPVTNEPPNLSNNLDVNILEYNHDENRLLEIEIVDCLDITDENIIIDLCKPLNLKEKPSPHNNNESEFQSTSNEQQIIDFSTKVIDDEFEYQMLIPNDLSCKNETDDPLSSDDKDSDTFPPLEISESDDDIRHDYKSTVEHMDSFDEIVIDGNADVIIENDKDTKENVLPEDENSSLHSSKLPEHDECIKNEDKPPTKNKMPELQMSLLELECKLDGEDELIFEDDDEDLDAIVLDTSSCGFDSPNEDRFQNSTLVAIDDENNEISAVNKAKTATTKRMSQAISP
ncbi:uncharacterized protein isoform X2 [Musca autumnalis]|uniref:uncharacterized protein isoform X2 n=1 Tax=Musca autumnalis TaxID=221902 RepID=UPI003CFB1583